jgi:hypothetical protein
VFEERADSPPAGEESGAQIGEQASESAAMPTESAGLDPAHETGETPSAVRAVAVALAGWLLPGLGHALLKMWGRAMAIFLTVGFLVYLGAGMRGNVFGPGGDDAFARLGYIADAGTGALYFVARSLEFGGSDVSHADGDYGTRFLATAGVLNLLAALHAYEAARGRKA